MGLRTGKGVRSNWGTEEMFPDHLDVMARQFVWNDMVKNSKLYNASQTGEVLDGFYSPENVDATYLPINLSVGSDSRPLAIEVLEELIRRSPHRIISKKCTCRDAHNCEKFDAAETGCIHIGAATYEESAELAYHATVDEAIEHLHKCVEKGLVPFIGHIMFDHIFWDVDLGNPFLTVCFCCECCCTNFNAYRSGVMDRGQYSFDAFKPLEGFKVTVDPNKCIGCGTCNKVCFSRCISVDEDNRVAVWDQKRCKACGECELNCPTKAISISLEDPKKAVDDLLRRLDPQVGGLALDEFKMDI